MRVGRAVLFAVGVACAACSAVLGLRDIEEGAPLIVGDATGVDRASGDTSAETSVETDGAAEGAADGGTDAQPPCKTSDAIVCDDFESGDLAKWRVIQQQGGVVVLGRPTLLTEKALRVGFGPLPAVGKASLQFDTTVPQSKKRALRFWVWLPADFYPTIPIAGFVDGTDQGLKVVLFQPDGSTDWELRVEDTRGGTPAALGKIAQELWQCVELVVGPTPDFTARLSERTQAGTLTATTLSAIGMAEFGITWTQGANNNASFSVFYDDVVVGGDTIGCGP